MPAAARTRQRGAAALGLTLSIAAVLALGAGFAHRNALFEQRSAANQLRATRAFETAEAGLAWAQAMLDQGAAIGADCEPVSAGPGDTTFRDRYLAWDEASGRFAPREWAAPGGPQALAAACVATDTGYACHCPADGAPVLEAPDGSEVRPAFVVRFAAAARPGMIELAATGCEPWGAACQGAAANEANAVVRVTLALLPALASAPDAALTARGTIASDAALALVNTSGSGLAARAGGAIALPAAELTGLPGRSHEEALDANAAALAALDADAMFVRLLGVGRARWQRLPGVNRIACGADCGEAIAAAAARTPGGTMLWVSGDLELAGPATLGSAERPWLIVVEGRIRMHGGVQVHGVVVALADAWDTGGNADLVVNGAVVAFGDLGGAGTPLIVRDEAVIERLQRQAGNFVRVAGSWRDF